MTLTPASVSLETTSYHDFADFAGRWGEVLRLVSGSLKIIRQDRIGLRYINELPCRAEPDPAEIRRLVREELVGVVGVHPRTGRLLGSMHESASLKSKGSARFVTGL